MTNNELAENELKVLHGQEYAEKFEKFQDPMRVGRIIERIPIRPGMTVGDFGCGNALSLEYLNKNNVQKYFGIDFSKELLTFAQQRKYRLKFDQAEFYEQPVQEFCKDHRESIDVALAMDFSEHIYDKDWLDILRSIHMALKPGGSLYMHTPNAQFFLEMMKERNFIVKQFPEHIAVRGSRENKKLLQEAGFSQIIVNFIPHYNILKYIHFLSYIPFVGKYFKARLFIRAIK